MFDPRSTALQVEKLCKTVGDQFTPTVAGATQPKVWGVFGPVENKQAQGVPPSNVSNINNTTVVIYFPALGRWTPQPGDLVNDGAKTYMVIDVMIYKPGKTAIAYKVTAT